MYRRICQLCFLVGLSATVEAQVAPFPSGGVSVSAIANQSVPQPSTTDGTSSLGVSRVVRKNSIRRYAASFSKRYS